MPKFNILLAKKYGNQSDEASIVGCGLDRLKSEYGIIFDDEDDVEKIIWIYNKYKEQFKKIVTIDTKRDLIKLICFKDWNTVEENGIKISKEDKEFLNFKKIMNNV
ncbi:hypothetical protein [Sulfurimonas sp.]|uniref:hypothetical protein n=1 Tax=Sulfurimonas sp. TaxID=2022749 RepID=UPI0026124335|nr:hypothetical protein [Sulfurimonas sp.]MDD3450949.1 hypothetical protein [Sulfurimonas sp.]